jgi:hypothetical protein
VGSVLEGDMMAALWRINNIQIVCFLGLVLKGFAGDPVSGEQLVRGQERGRKDGERRRRARLEAWGKRVGWLSCAQRVRKAQEISLFLSGRAVTLHKKPAGIETCTECTATPSCVDA